MQQRKQRKIKISPTISLKTVEKLKKMSKKHGLSQAKIIERAFNRELKILEQMDPII